MGSTFLLSPVEVEELTGSPQRRRQMAWLREHGFAYEVGTDGKVKVLRAAVEARMMPSHGRQKAKTEPNLAALKKAS
jgi:hypothetical protein